MSLLVLVFYFSHLNRIIGANFVSSNELNAIDNTDTYTYECTKSECYIESKHCQGKRKLYCTHRNGKICQVLPGECKQYKLYSMAGFTEVVCEGQCNEPEMGIEIYIGSTEQDTNLYKQLNDVTKCKECNAITFFCAIERQCICSSTKQGTCSIGIVRTDAPTMNTKSPIKSPTTSPSVSTAIPSKFPTNIPTTFPTINPTESPSTTPTNAPSKTPTNMPTDSPTNGPSLNPSTTPTNTPSKSPMINELKSGSQSQGLLKGLFVTENGKPNASGIIITLVIAVILCLCFIIILLLLHRNKKLRKDMEIINHPFPNKERVTSVSDINYSPGLPSETPNYIQPKHTSIEAEIFDNNSNDNITEVNKVNQVNEGENDDDDDDLYDTPTAMVDGYPQTQMGTRMTPNNDDINNITPE